MRLQARIRFASICFISNLLPFVAVVVTNVVQAEAMMIDEERPVSSPQTIAFAVVDPGDNTLLPPAEIDTYPDEAPPNLNIPARPRLLPLNNLIKFSGLQNAYMDAFEILSTENSCSRFFGGPSAAQVLNELAQRITISSLHYSVAVRMTGKVTLVRSNAFQVSYRLFDKAELNMNGSFFKRHVFPTDPHIPSVGDFQPNTPEARVTILLHELGHLVQSEDKRWLLPDDGRDLGVSLKNTETILDACAADIRTIARKKR